MPHDPNRRKPEQVAGDSRQQPPSPEKKRILRQISRARTRLLVCLMTLPVYMVAVWVLLNNQRDIDTFMFIYMGVWAAFGVDMARRRCPACGEQYFVKVVLLNLRTRRCVHCGLALDQNQGSDDQQRMNL